MLVAMAVFVVGFGADISLSESGDPSFVGVVLSTLFAVVMGVVTLRWEQNRK